jgi:hypothetical protein
MVDHEFRRIHERRKYGADIIFSHKGRAYRGTIKNLSLGGAFIVTPNPTLFSKGETITASIPFTDGKKNLKRRGLIKWLNNEGFAIEFY